MGRLNLAFEYDCTYVISASHTMCEALIRETLKDIYPSATFRQELDYLDAEALLRCASERPFR